MPLDSMTRGQRFHTLPQWRHVVDERGDIAYLDHVGRFEDLKSTLSWLQYTLRLPSGRAMPFLKGSAHGYDPGR